ncbi:MAG: hypothetical protein GC164_05900 [Phycisphaera sp.]|nr:hypothetical protein [Phycisphaera sp.]
MTVQDHTLTHPAHEHFNHAWDRILSQEPTGPTQRAIQRRLSDLTHFSNTLVELLCEFHDRPASHLGPMIRRIIVEQEFIDDTGDSMIDQDFMVCLDHYVDMIVEALEQVRQRCRREGHWSDTPITPLMCG